MIKFKSVKSIFMTSVLTLGISVIASQNAFAATLTTKTYTVKSGDCLSVIAQKHGETLADLRKANNNLADLIIVGQVINVSGTTSSVPQKTAPTAINHTASDVDLLARLITAEAQGESYEAQVGVGAVVVNRVNSGKFPNSISSVINQKTNSFYQFTPVQNGNINKPATASALKAAYAALSGNDPTNKALFFYSGAVNSKLTVPQPISTKIDDLTFVYLLNN